MMEKRNYVTSGRTVNGADDIDDIIDSCSDSFKCVKRQKDSDFVKRASSEDEKSDKEDGISK